MGRNKNMFNKRPTTTREDILQELAKAYDWYNSQYAEWSYSSEISIGTFLIDGCITNSKFLERILAIIGQGLEKNDPYARKSCLLFEHLYYNGFKESLFKDAIQASFKEILPAKSIERLTAKEASMEACMKSINSYTQIMGAKVLR
jgi:hypothetical protein